MKKTLLCIFLGLLTISLWGQSLNRVKRSILHKKYPEARAGLDKWLSNPKHESGAEAWYLKAFVYNALALAPNTSPQKMDTLNQAAFAALKKYMQMDPDARLTIKEENTTAYNLYHGFYDLGIKNYNKKDLQAAYAGFSKALEVHDYINNKHLAGPKGIRLAPHDTMLVWTLAFLATDLKKMNEALLYNKMIADAGLTDERYEGGYEMLVSNYKTAGNKQLFDRYLAVANKNYPDNSYWDIAEMEYAATLLQGDELFKKYEDMLAKYPTSYIFLYNYAVDLDRYIKNKPTSMDNEVYRQRWPELLKKAIAVNSTFDANRLLSLYHYNSAIDLFNGSKKIIGKSNEEIKMKSGLVSAAEAEMNRAIRWAEDAVNLFGSVKEFKPADKDNYQQLVEMLNKAKQGSILK